METLKQTLVIPDNHQLRFDVSLPLEFPTGLVDVLLVFSPKTKPVMTKGAAMLKFAGALKTSIHFSGDPVEVQKTMRNEWQR